MSQNSHIRTEYSLAEDKSVDGKDSNTVFKHSLAEHLEMTRKNFEGYKGEKVQSVGYTDHTFVVMESGTVVHCSDWKF
jgi:hypothetical protein